MPVYIGDNSSKARKVKHIYVGDENSKARLVKLIYVGDENNKAQLVRNYENPVWTASNGAKYNKTNFPHPSTSNSEGYNNTFTSDFVLREGDTFSLTATHSATIAEGESDSMNVFISLLADGEAIKESMDLSFVGDKSTSKIGTISGTIGKSFANKALQIRLSMEGAGSYNTTQELTDIELVINEKYLIV